MSEETKPNEGAIQFKNGKSKMFINGEWVDFDLNYIANDMRRVARGAHGYGKILRMWASELEVMSKENINWFIEKLKSFYGAKEQWMAQDCKIWYGWLNQIYQFRNIKTNEESKEV